MIQGYRIASAMCFVVAGFFALLLVVDIAYMIHGSLDMFPTEENQAGVREMTTVFGVVFASLTVLFLWLGKRFWNACSISRDSGSQSY